MKTDPDSEGTAITPSNEPEKLQVPEDLWKHVFPVGTEWDQLDFEYEWNFRNLEDAFEEGGVLHGRKVYLFSATKPQLLFMNGQSKVTCIPVVVAVVSPFPPSDKIGIKSVQREVEEIVDMKQMKMDWVPYIPYGKRAERQNPQIFMLSCVKEDFYHPFREDETEQSTVVNIMFPAEPPVVCEFDWEMDELEEFTNELIASEKLTEDQKDEFKEFVKEKVREAKRANLEAREKRKKALEEMDQNAVAAFENMRFYKFYPGATPDTPDVSHVMECGSNIEDARGQLYLLVASSQDHACSILKDIFRYAARKLIILSLRRDSSGVVKSGLGEPPRREEEK
ncbi:hypothetical protein CTI12_AA414080 [Artemisia annua]|uniref:Protein HEAT INTOLERANT 4-like n=1 Tax=Artemisia annua TaxID=35608 RepID=A0A2U1M6J5_ARTAN|nr:hypothetical protein CTI12_AA414080 [Artemisia annua]